MSEQFKQEHFISEGPDLKDDPEFMKLYEKENTGTLTEEESAIIDAWREFPRNPNIRDLRAKEMLGTITEKERSELDRIRSEKYKDK